MPETADVVVVGAGPYGLSVASHLLAQNVETRVFGTPMQFWASTLRRGCLKSEGFATNLSEPSGTYTLGTFCIERGYPYQPTGIPVPFKTFTEYGREFQRRFVPSLEDKAVTKVAARKGSFEVQLHGGRSVVAKNVIVATGLSGLSYVPDVIGKLPAALHSHSSAYGDVSRFAGNEVAVVGAGASATDLAAHLIEAGAKVSIITRRPGLKFHSSLGERNLWDKVRAPMTYLGPGWKSVLCVEAPLLFHAMPEKFRLYVVGKYLGPAPAWFVRDRVEGNVEVLGQVEEFSADERQGRVQIGVKQAGGTTRRIMFDHVVAATGYRPDVKRMACLGSDIVNQLRTNADRSPALSRNFESSIRGLYFVGLPSASSFGPMLRFVCGSRFASGRIANHLTRPVRHRAVELQPQTA